MNKSFSCTAERVLMCATLSSRLAATGDVPVSVSVARGLFLAMA